MKDCIECVNDVQGLVRMLPDFPCECPGDSYYEPVNAFGEKECVKCPMLCSSCNGPSVANCTACINVVGVQHNDELLEPCFIEDAYFVDAVKQQVMACSVQQCMDCDSEDFCHKCKSRYLILNQYCFSDCPQGSYKLNYTHCTSCPERCSECSSPILCSFCNSGWYL